MPLWVTQGKRFEHQSTLWAEARTNGEIHMSKGQAERFLEDESRTLEDRDRPRSSTDVTSLVQTSQNKNLNLVMERCHEFDSLKFNSAKLQEEQERELSPEIEQERQVQKLAPAQPAEDHIHPDLIMFMSTGILINGSQAYKPAFETLATPAQPQTSTARSFPMDFS